MTKKTVGLNQGGAAKLQKNKIQLKVCLNFIEPDIWRRVIVPDTCSLGDLHAVVQIAMGWHNCHLHRFEIEGVNYTFGDEAPEMDMEDEDSVFLRDVLKGEGQTFYYEYDFGDSWLHTIVVEKMIDTESAEQGAFCVDGARACPPEDCGSYPGYEELLSAFDASDPDEEQEELLEWLKEMYGEYDPESLDLNTINKQLLKLNVVKG